jgi:uncharacterized protein YbaP (TraB family)
MQKLARLAVVVVCGCGMSFAQQGAPTAGAANPPMQSLEPPQRTTSPAAPVDGAPAQTAAKPVESTVVANPAIWRVKGAHGTVYLFGSIHVMKPNVDWETAKVKAAFAASDVVYEEVANLDDAAAAQPLALEFGTDLAHPLSTKISKDDVALLDAAAKSMGLPGEAMLEPMQPWLVSASLEVVPMMKGGFDPASGIDMKVLAEAKAAQKPVKGFETMSDQVHLLADAPQAQQVELLHKELAELDKAAAEMNDMVTAWERGDVEKIGKIDNDELAVKYPAEYKRLVVDRNTRWTTTLDGLLKDPATGTVFVVVGAAHLAGPDSVIKMLEKDGWKVERQ